MATDTENASPLTEADLKSCPFCGGPAHIAQFSGGPNGFAVLCLGACYVKPSTSCAPTKEAAIALWNTRATVRPCGHDPKNLATARITGADGSVRWGTICTQCQEIVADPEGGEVRATQEGR